MADRDINTKPLVKLVGLATVASVVLLLVLVVLSGCTCYGSYPKELIAGVLSDGDNTLVAYRLERNVGDHDVRLQKIAPDGDVLWDEVLYSGDNSRVGGVSMVAGDNSVLVAWAVYLPQHGSEGPHDFDHTTLASVDDEGNVRWQQDFPEEGVQMVVDGEGGVVLAWTDGASCYARRVDSAGDVLWEETIGGSGGLTMAAGGEGETFILWNDYDNHYFVVQKVGADGELLWPGEGVVVEYLEEAFQLEPQMVSDGMGGAIVAWVEPTSHQPADDLWLERISADGQDSVRSVIEGPLEAMHPNFQVVGDEPMGIIAVWEGSGDGIELSLMRDNPLSSYIWPTEGFSICSGLNKSPRFNAISDGRGGVVVAWIDGERRLYAQRLDSVGEKLWGDEGMLITHGACEMSVWVVGDSDKGFVLGWTSGFTTYNPDDSYIQRLDAEGNILWEEGGIRIGP
jgi:hypothetical protein